MTLLTDKNEFTQMLKDNQSSKERTATISVKMPFDQNDSSNESRPISEKT